MIADAVQLVQTGFDPTLSAPQRGFRKTPFKFQDSLQIVSPDSLPEPKARAMSDAVKPERLKGKHAKQHAIDAVLT